MCWAQRDAAQQGERVEAAAARHRTETEALQRVLQGAQERLAASAAAAAAQASEAECAPCCCAPWARLRPCYALRPGCSESSCDTPARLCRSAAASAQAAAAAELAAQRRAGCAAADAAAAAAGAELAAACGAGARERGAWAAERERAAAEAADLGRRLADGATAAAEWQRLARQLEADRLQQAHPDRGRVPGGVGCRPAPGAPATCGPAAAGAARQVQSARRSGVRG